MKSWRSQTQEAKRKFTSEGSWSEKKKKQKLSRKKK